MTTEFLIYGIAVVVMWFVAWKLRSVTARQALYLIASWLFYASWGSWLIVILVFSSLMNFALGEWLKKRITAGRLWTGLIANLALLSVFKYLPMVANIAPAGSPLLLLKRILFPVGISFWTFQAMSYLLEIYREEELDPTLLEFCLYMSFWPTVLQGPICRMSSMLPQFRQDWAVSDDDLKTGVRRVAIGILMSGLAMVMSGGLYAGAGVDALFNHATFANAATTSERDRRLVSDHRLRIPALLQLLRILSHRDRGSALVRDPVAGELQPALSVDDDIGISGRAGICRCRSGFATFFFCHWRHARREVWWRNLSLVIAMFVFGAWHIGAGEKGEISCYMMLGHLARHFAGAAPPVAGVPQAHGIRMGGAGADR